MKTRHRRMAGFVFSDSVSMNYVTLSAATLAPTALSAVR